MKKKVWLLALAGLITLPIAARAGTDMVSSHDYDINARAWQPPPPPEESAVEAPPPPVAVYAPPPPYYPPPYAYGPAFYGPAFYGPAIGIGFHFR